LVVDDEPDARFLLRYVFEQAGHEVSEAHNGIVALAAIKRSRPALVVTDMMMPVMDGAELIRQLRAAPDTSHIPILAITGNEDLAVAADAVLNKFGDLSGLVELAEELLNRGRDLR